MVERTDDGRYVIVDARRWRASDPTLRDAVRAELVAELMAARRAAAYLRTALGVEDGSWPAARDSLAADDDDAAVGRLESRGIASASLGTPTNGL